MDPHPFAKCQTLYNTEMTRPRHYCQSPVVRLIGEIRQVTGVADHVAPVARVSGQSPHIPCFPKLFVPNFVSKKCCRTFFVENVLSNKFRPRIVVQKCLSKNVCQTLFAQIG